MMISVSHPGCPGPAALTATLESGPHAAPATYGSQSSLGTLGDKRKRHLTEMLHTTSWLRPSVQLIGDR